MASSISGHARSIQSSALLPFAIYTLLLIPNRRSPASSPEAAGVRCPTGATAQLWRQGRAGHRGSGGRLRQGRAGWRRSGGRRGGPECAGSAGAASAGGRAGAARGEEVGPRKKGLAFEKSGVGDAYEKIEAHVVSPIASQAAFEISQK